MKLATAAWIVVAYIVIVILLSAFAHWSLGF